MRKELPVRPNLEHLKSQAKDLLEAFRRGDAAALERFRSSLPAARGSDAATLAAAKLALHDAQSVIAREYGFTSWTELREEIAKRAPTSETIRELMLPHLTLPLPSEVQAALAAAASARPPKETPLATTLPLLPLRNAVLTVGSVAPLEIGRPTTLAAIEAARANGMSLAVFAQRDEAVDASNANDLHPVGCAAQLVARITTADRGTWVVVRATRWILVESVERDGAAYVARVAPFAVQQERTEHIERMESALRDHVRVFAATLPDGKFLLELVRGLSALELADLAMGNLPCSVEEKARYASEPSLTARLTTVLALFDRAA